MFVAPAPLQMQNSHPAPLEAALSFQGAYRRLSDQARLSVRRTWMFSYGPWEAYLWGWGQNTQQRLLRQIRACIKEEPRVCEVLSSFLMKGNT